MNRRVTILILILTAHLGCEEKFDDLNISDPLDLIVVEGILTNEKINHRIKITRPHLSQNEIPTPVANAFVAIGDSDNNVHVLTEFPTGSGEYYTDSLRAVFGKFYGLFIRYEGKEYRAFDTPRPGQLLDPVEFNETHNDGEIQYSLKFRESGSQPNYISYDIDWSSTSHCNSTNDCKGQLIYYDLKTIDVHEIYAPDKADFFFPQGTVIKRKRYSLSDNYQDYLRSVLSETEWRGGFFDIDRSNVPTNLSEGAIGFFAVSTVVTDTVIVN